MADLPYNQHRGAGQCGHPAGGGYAMNDSAVWSDVGTDDGADMLPRQQYNSPYGAVRTNNNGANPHDPYSDRSPGGAIPSGGGGMKGQYEKVMDPSYDAAETGDSDFVVKEKRPVHVATEVIATTRTRRWWIRITWFFTWWIPSFLLVHVGRMKRPDIRMAWREKLAIFMMVALLCGTVLFYVIVFGRLLCPDMDKAWNPTELSTHQGRDDYYAAIQGKVYDFTTFYKGQHSDLSSFPTSADIMLQFAGQDLTNYFPPPMSIACPGLVTNDQLFLQRANFTPILSYAVHTSGPLQTDTKTALRDINWYNDKLMPSLQQYYKGSLVYDHGTVSNLAEQDSRQWAIYKNKVYDLSDYLYTKNYYSSSSGTDLPNYSFLPDSISSIFQSNSGQDVTSRIDDAMQSLSTEQAQQTWTCLDNAFFYGQTDFRETARCKVQNYILLALSIILCTVIGTKFLAALQLGSKRHPEIFDKFVICQVPCYTEGEESLKKTVDSLAVLNYDDKRKLIFIICDGNIIGSGNNRPTPRIVLDILGVDPKLDPEPLLFKSIGEGSKQLNYAKVYSGLYEFEGHVVPYIVVVKVGKPSETNRPGNRGKRDSQVLLMQYLNRVHFDAPMSPLELEIYHQMRNVIGIDPTFYEYIFQVDADTTVMPDSLNRLIACTSDDSTIIGICGETKLANERESLTTMIQVYEYFISHHLTKAFESLFGSVTCLPGCFSVYRIRTADKGRPVIISSVVIDEYAEPNVDTLHKKNLFSLGEDRYLTTLMMKHFPTFKMKFTPDAIAHTVAPSSWSVLLSQRRRWINSTVHNLVELMTLPELCGFCCFSMRFVVFIDLLGTIILPATFGYILYLIIVVSTGKAPLPLISIIMIAAVYGLQAIIFILKREFMLIGWMLLYILAFPIYSVWLPLYSFWSMDDFSWGNTRKVVGEGDKKTVVYENDEPFSDNMIPYKSFKEYEANAWETQSLHSDRSRETDHSASVSQRDYNGGGDRASSYGRPRFPNSGSRPNSAHSSSAELPAGADYWRDSSPLGPSHSSRNLRQQGSSSSLRPGSMAGGMGSRMPSMAGMSMWNGNPGQTGSMYDLAGQGALQPHMTGMSNGSMGMGMPMHMGMPMGQMGMGGMGMGMGMGRMGQMGQMSPMGMPMMMGSPGMMPHNPFDNQSQMGGMGMNGGMGGMGGMGAPRNTVMTNLGGMAGPGSVGGGDMASPIGAGQGGDGQGVDGQGRGMSTYSLGTTHPLAQLPDVSDKADPSDEEVVDALRRYLATQDLMRVTRRQTREAVYGLFPNANLKSRAGWVNENIDKVLSAES